MTDILPPAGWPNVRQLETNEFATGGANGNMNEQAKSLAARSELLKQYAALPYESKTGGYALNERVHLENGDIVKSTVANNIVDPNVNMTGWVKVNAATQIFDESGLSQQDINNFVLGPLSKRFPQFSSLSEAKDAIDLLNYSTIYVNGFSISGDGGAAFWDVIPAETVDNYTIVALNNDSTRVMRLNKNQTVQFFFQY